MDQLSRPLLPPPLTVDALVSPDMSPDQEHRLEEIFSAVRDLPLPERPAFLERACGGYES
jgi:hypothetical protein